MPARPSRRRTWSARSGPPSLRRSRCSLAYSASLPRPTLSRRSSRMPGISPGISRARKPTAPFLAASRCPASAWAYTLQAAARVGAAPRARRPASKQACLRIRTSPVRYIRVRKAIAGHSGPRCAWLSLSERQRLRQWQPPCELRRSGLPRPQATTSGGRNVCRRKPKGDLMPSPGNPFPSARVIGPSVMSVLADIARQLEPEMAGLSSKDWSPVHDDPTSETGFSRPCDRAPGCSQKAAIRRRCSGLQRVS